MYTLRMVETTKNKNGQTDRIIENYWLGNAYARVNKGTKEFDRIMDRYPDYNKDKIMCIICSDIIRGQEEYNPTNEYLLWEDTEIAEYSYFIMTNTGKTFERL